MKKGIKYFTIMAIAYGIGGIGALAVSTIDTLATVLTFAFSYNFLFFLHALTIKKLNPHVLKRSAGKETGEALIYVIAAFVAITLIVASWEYRMVGMQMPQGLTYIGYGLILVAHFLAQSTLNAKAPHGKDRYSEELEGKEGGPYDIIRHPMALVIACIVLSIPFLFCVTYAFIPAGLAVVACLIWVGKKDQWRFVNYDWYYDYTKRVSYRFLPFIW